jgi:hypothetical protein
MIQPPQGSVQGRAARGEHGGLGTGLQYYFSLVSLDLCFSVDDYYDTEDPSVNLQEFIVNSMQVCGVLICKPHYLVSFI